MKNALSYSRDGVFISLRVSPGAKRTAVEGVYGEDSLKLKVAAPPVDGKANAEVEAFLAKLLGVRKSDVEVIRGMSNRNKTVLVRGVNTSAVGKAISERL